MKNNYVHKKRSREDCAFLLLLRKERHLYTIEEHAEKHGSAPAQYKAVPNGVMEGDLFPNVKDGSDRV